MWRAAVPTRPAQAPALAAVWRRLPFKVRVGPVGQKRLIVAAELSLPVNTAGAGVGSAPAAAGPEAQGDRALYGEAVEGSAVPAGHVGGLVRAVHAGDARQPRVHSVSYRR